MSVRGNYFCHDTALFQKLFIAYDKHYVVDSSVHLTVVC